MATQRQQFSWAKGAYDDGTDPHRVYAPSEIKSAVGWANTFGFYSAENGGLFPETSAQFPFSYPFGPMYPNPYVYNASVPGNIDIRFANRPFL